MSKLDFGSFFNIINGKHSSSKTSHRGIDPITREPLWDVPVASQQDVDDAVTSASEAFKTWSRTPIKKRQALVTEVAELWGQYENEMTDLLCKETGKPRMFALDEVKTVALFLRYYTTVELPTEIVEDDEKIIKTTYQPLGVCAGICPWNFPLVLCVGKIAAAITTGNTIIVKPSPYTPYTTLKMVEIMQAILPPGVVQAVGGTDEVGPMLTAHPGIAKISVTGSIATGKKIMAACSNTLKRVTLELGGNDACIVLPDVDIATVAPQVAIGTFFNSGQVCLVSKRLYVHESIYEPFIAAVTQFVENNMAVGKSEDAGVFLGPVQNQMQYGKVKEISDDSASKGYKFLTGEPGVQTLDGYFLKPAIIDNPPNDSRIIREEPFGPIVPVQPWVDEDEIIDRANDTNSGLGACIWSKDIPRAESIGERLDVGTVWINSFAKPHPAVFLSGHKESGIGGENGRQGLLSYCNTHVMQTYK